MNVAYKHYAATIVLAAFIILTLSAYHGGPATGGIGNQTGSPGAGNCGNCHNGGTDTTFSSISIRKKGHPSGDSIRYYTASETYVITIRGKHNTYNTFGYQMLLLDTNKIPKGKFISFGNYGHGHPLSNPNIAENNTRIKADTSGWFEDVLEWQSPTKSSGKLTLYAIVNAVDYDGKPSNDKVGNTMSITLQDSIPPGIDTSTGIGNKITQPYISIYPNPANNVMNIYTNNDHSDLKLSLFDIHGRHISKYTIYQHTNIMSINTSSIADGYYILAVSDTKHSKIVLVRITH